MGQIGSAFSVIRQAWAHWAAAWLKLVMINVAWALSMYTVILAPPAVLALVAAARDAAQDQPVTLGSYFRYLKSYFLIGWLWAAVNGLFAAVVYANVVFYAQFAPDFRGLANAVMAGLVILWVCIQYLTVVYLVWQDNRRLLKALRYGVFTFGASPLFMLVLVVLIGFITLISLYFNGLPLLLTASFIAVLGAQAVQNRLRAFAPADQTAEPPVTD
jgi:uncharacterized membrane protein YesL